MKEHDPVTDALRRANPLNDEEFVKEIHLAMLTYNDHDKLPRKVEQTFQIRDLWNSVGSKDTSPAFEARFTRAALPNYHAILAEALHCEEACEPPNFIDLHARALESMRVLLRQRVKEIGKEATYHELRSKFLQAAAQAAEAGFTSQALSSIALIVGLSRLNGDMR